MRKWKARFAAKPCLASLEDAPRSGRPARITIATRCELVQLACARPEGCKSPAPFRDLWTYRSLAESLRQRTGQVISTSEVGRILRFEDLRPHRVRQWLKSTDPEFRVKADRVCQLYLAPPKDAIVVCVDEKPLQVLGRKHPTRVDPRDASVRFEYEYVRHGTQALLAAFDVRTGRVLGRVVPHRSADALVAFMEELARQYPSQTVYVVWDNLNIHYDGADERWSQFNARHRRRFHFVYTPKHASWMNQIEIWFSILQRRIIKHGDFPTPHAQASRVRGFIEHWNRNECHPFRWTWRTDRLQNRRVASPMPAPAAEPHHATQVARLLHQQGAKHTRTRKHGAAVIVESGPVADSVKHFRLRRDTVHLWRLDMATHTGRWEATPFRAQLEELVTMVLESFPWTLTPIA